MTTSNTIERQQGMADRLVDAAARLLDQATAAIREGDDFATPLTGLAERVLDRARDLYCVAWRATGDHAHADRLGALATLADAESAELEHVRAGNELRAALGEALS